jgi:hypothetical protein
MAFKNAIKAFWGKSMSKTQKKLPKKLRKTTFFPVVCFPRFFVSFLAVSLHEELKNTIKTFSRIKPENLKQSQKNGRYVAFVSFFLQRPWAHGRSWWSSSSSSSKWQVIQGAMSQGGAQKGSAGVGACNFLRPMQGAPKTKTNQKVGRSLFTWEGDFFADFVCASF